MTSSEVWDEETAERYDTDSAEMFAADVLDPAVDVLAAWPARVRRWSSRSAPGGSLSRSPPVACP